MKVIDMGKGSKENDVNLQESIILERLKNDFIISHERTYFVNEKLLIIMEYCSGGSIRQILNFMNFDEDQVASVLYCLTKGISYLHSQGVIHRDIKAANILLTKDGIAKIADFGVSRFFTEGQLSVTLAGSFYWMAPEILKTTPYNYKADIWSLGITAIEISDGHPPNSHNNVMQFMMKISQENYSPSLKYPNNSSKKFLDFLHGCLQRDPQNRITADELLSIPFITEIENQFRSNLIQIYQNTHKYVKEAINNKSLKLTSFEGLLNYDTNDKLVIQITSKQPENNINNVNTNQEIIKDEEKIKDNNQRKDNFISGNSSYDDSIILHYSQGSMYDSQDTIIIKTQSEEKK